MLDTPVALVVFNRPDTTAQVMAKLSEIRPRRLLVAADGPRPDRPEDAEKCREVRRIVTTPDWPCEVITHFNDANLGSRRQPPNAIGWIFSEVEEAIILEDDCVPHSDFFPYCTTLLERYRDDSRIALISGSNVVADRVQRPDSYLFSRYAFIWGWAGWRRSWANYDLEMAGLRDFIRRRGFERVFSNRSLAACWLNMVCGYTKPYKPSWDYQLMYACMAQSQYAVVPTRNLITNVGVGHPDAAQGRDSTELGGRPAGGLSGPLRHPPFILPDDDFDAIAAQVVWQVDPLVFKPQRNPADPRQEELLRKATAELQAGHADTAEETLLEAFKIDRRNPQVCNLLGVINYRKGKYDLALHCMWAAVLADPDFVTAYANIASINMAARRVDEAAEIFIHMLTLQPDNPEAQVGLCRALAAAGHWAEAADALGAARAVVGESAELADLARRIADAGRS